MEVIIQVPIRTYLKKFLAKTNNIYPFELRPNKCHISAMILESLSVPELEKWENSFMLTDSIEFSINGDLLRTHDFSISNDRLKKIDQYLRSLFIHTFGSAVSLKYHETGDVFRSVRLFMDYYGLDEDDIMFETLVKDFYRFRQINVDNKVLKRIKKRRRTFQDQQSLFD